MSALAAGAAAFPLPVRAVPRAAAVVLDAEPNCDAPVFVAPVLPAGKVADMPRREPPPSPVANPTAQSDALQETGGMKEDETNKGRLSVLIALLQPRR